MTLAYRMHDKQWTHQGHSVTAPGKKKQASKREPAHDAWRAKPAQKIDSCTLVHTVGGRVSSPWGPARDVAHPPVNAERSGSEANGRQSARGEGGERNINIGRRVFRSDRCVALSLGSRVRHAMFAPYLPAGMHVSEPHSSRVWVWGPGLGRLRFAVGRLGNSERWEWQERRVRHGMVDVDFQLWAAKMMHESG